ncbi:helix-turn-helix transcriptional regulator [Nocardioides sp. Soil796]|uniref:helix-turn-helix transcriptional regulator n=1 Tax=Nocardioides sp. Soil796 TaxID=1736412 RepID=UPI00070FB062|nr:WYL domain-containing protein [Nocardioides sp. Soil796]KRF11916.1 DNA-binding protein [Nocardioides sp. Soil796]
MQTDVSPTARALLTLELLQSQPGITARRLAERLGVSDRAVRRYVDILREAGIPVESERGPYGGYRVGRGLRLPPLTFTATEALGVVMAVLDGHHRAGDPTEPVGSALGKIVRALPEPVAAQAESVRRAAAPVPDRSAARPDPGTTTALVEAVSDHHVVRLDYRSEAGTEWTCEAEPWAVVVRHGRWYLLCRLVDRDSIRTLRVDRVRAVEQLEATFTPRPDLDPVAELEKHLSVGWEFEVDVVIDAPLASIWFPRALGSLEAIDEATTRLTGTTSNPWMYAEALAGLSVPYRIVGGDEVRAAARKVAERMLAATQG